MWKTVTIAEELSVRLPEFHHAARLAGFRAPQSVAGAWGAGAKQSEYRAFSRRSILSHFVHTHDGKVLVVGGSDPDYHIPGGGGHGSVGERYIHLFDPVTETWNTAMNGATPSRLRQGRWYPTAVMLGDGRIAVFSGRREFGAGPANASPAALRAGTAEAVEILTPPTFASTLLATANISLPIYPGLHLAPNGRVYYTHTTWGLEIDPPNDTVSIAIPMAQRRQAGPPRGRAALRVPPARPRACRAEKRE